MTSLHLVRWVGATRQSMSLFAQGSPGWVEVSETTTPPYPRRSKTTRRAIRLEDVYTTIAGWPSPTLDEIDGFVTAVKAGKVYDPFEGVYLGGAA